MVVRFESGCVTTMDYSLTTHPAATFTRRLPLRPSGLPDKSSPAPFLQNPQWKTSTAASSLAVESSVRSPTSSCCSHDSFPESDATMSTAPSSPRSPSAKQEYIDVQMHSISSRRPSTHPYMTAGDTRLPPMLPPSSTPEILPGLNSILRVPAIVHPQEPSVESTWKHRKYSSSPEPSVSDEYMTSRYPRVDCKSQDPIAQYLNEERRRRSVDHQAWRKTSSPDNFDLSGLTSTLINLDYSKPRSYRHSSHDYSGHMQDRGLDPLRHVQQGGIRREFPQTTSRRKDSKIPHCNKRYTVEQMHFIRYLKVDCSKSWSVIAREVAKYFPEEGISREVQGVQGVYYRQNKFAPEVDLQTNTITYLPNGHMKGVTKGCRNQKDKKQYGLINLWPEMALKYDWVLDKHKEQAKKLGMPYSPPIMGTSCQSANP
jgi:hypothetical protein